MIEKINLIRSAIDQRVSMGDPHSVWDKLEMCCALLGTSAETASTAKKYYDSERQDLFKNGIVKKTDSTAFVESMMPEATELKEYTESLQRNLRDCIEGLRTLLSYLRDERNNPTRG